MANQRVNRRMKLQIWLTPAEHQLFSEVSEATGQTISSYVRSTVLREIKKDFNKFILSKSNEKSDISIKD